ncbi:Thioredoxin X, chloroplastic [Galdieria sulphuraria]|uniref:Thioredoxin 1 n=1 Tax=Galdieria sulphuraria TaxID=130081 RepID=M2XHT7_GALSU|nr:thioredoxin 1 [Galdieria sulphuraria]EME29657.1 thioredoxin 1 [Galdieria sulphuraria]GJD12192.1 Thioredoxin X, chloroplastic [Galdieria sulphuraria]|eukprot:XP_005706177.1 thioredoxin 1 [Galdieria sulphuraria]
MMALVGFLSGSLCLNTKLYSQTTCEPQRHLSKKSVLGSYLLRKQLFTKHYKRPNSLVVMTVVEVDDTHFEQQVLQSQIPVLVDFHADWCGPCKLVTPLLDWLVSEYGGKLKVVKIDTDKNPRYVKQYDVRGLPTLIIFQDGRLVASSEGALGKKGIQQYIEKHLPQLKTN